MRDKDEEEPPRAARPGQWCVCPACGTGHSLALYYCLQCGARTGDAAPRRRPGLALAWFAAALVLAAVAGLAVAMLSP